MASYRKSRLKIFTKMSKAIAKIPSMAAGLVSSSKPKIVNFARYARVELVPPTPGEVGQAVAAFGKVINGFKTGQWKKVTVREGWLNALVTTEIICCFFIGECIGKGTLIGYQV